ncbi:MAG: CRISPR-associated endonuclease Cas2 [Patescibacteria group bacterium]
MAYDKKNQSLSKTLLYILFQAGKTIGDSITIANDTRRWQSALLQGGLGYLRLRRKLENERNARQAFYNLKRNNYIKAKKIGKRLILSLTSKGTEVLLREQLLRAPKHHQQYFTVVAFDIPESENRARRQFRWFLRQSGFKKLQQSVWVNNRNVYKPLADLIKQLNIDGWVNVFVANNFLRPPQK